MEKNTEKVDKKVQTPDPKSLSYQRDRDREMVRGIFKFYEVPGGSVSFNYRAYKQDPVERFDMIDGQIYTIPLGVAKHLNKNCWYPIHNHMVDKDGVPVARIGQKVRRMGFQSLEFVDVDDLTFSPEITTVEAIGR